MRPLESKLPPNPLEPLSRADTHPGLAILRKVAERTGSRPSEGIWILESRAILEVFRCFVCFLAAVRLQLRFGRRRGVRMSPGSREGGETGRQEDPANGGEERLGFESRVQGVQGMLIAEALSKQCFRARRSYVPSLKPGPHELCTGLATCFSKVPPRGRQDVLSTCHPADKHARRTRVP